MKKWYKSKTMWVNISVLFAGAVSLLPNLEGVLSSDQYGIAVFVVGLINVGLRTITKTRVAK